jgi:hypothetical protein
MAKPDPVVNSISSARRSETDSDDCKFPAIRQCALAVRAACLVMASAVVLMTAGTPLQAQNYSIDWFTIDGGGGTSSGGAYSVTGTIGQPDAGHMSGGQYTLTGGFWSLVNVIQTPGAPFLKVAQSDGAVAISWPLPATGFVLEETPVLVSAPAAIPWNLTSRPYQTNATHIFITVPTPLGRTFYRLRHQ